MKWIDTLINTDVSMSMEARKFGKARMTINYYADMNGVVRKVLERGALETVEIYDKGELGD